LDSEFFWPIAIAASVFVGMGKGGLPVIAMLGVPTLALVISPVTAAGLLLPVYVASDVFGLMAYRRTFDKRVLTIAVVGSTFGVALGWALARVVPDSAVTLAIGVIGAAFAFDRIIRRESEFIARQPRWRSGLFWTSLAGFTSFVSHSGGAPYQVWVLPLRLTKSVFVGTSVIAFAYVNALKLIPYYYLGQLGQDNLKVAVILMVPAALAVWLGVWLVRWLPEKRFFQLVTWTLLLLSVKLISDGVQGLVA
jgi:uncharacterized membrane protein YfcA